MHRCDADRAGLLHDQAEGWYDLVITEEGDAGFQYHFAGYVETGRDSISDPALNGHGWTIAGKDEDDE